MKESFSNLLFRIWRPQQIEEMGSEKLYAYNRTGGIVIGVIEIVLGLLVFIFQIVLFAQDATSAHFATGLWAGLYVSIHCSRYHRFYVIMIMR